MAAATVTEIHPLLSRSAIRVGMEGEDKYEIIDQMVNLLETHPAVEDIDQVREAVMEREQRMSTGVGKELGLPHAKTDAVTDTVAAFAITRESVDFESIDSQPVRILFLLVGPESAKSQHIKLLSRISRLMNREELRQQLLSAESAEEVLELFRESEARLAEG